MSGGAEGIGPDSEGVAHEAIVRAMRSVLMSEADYDTEAADAILDALRSLPVERRMEAMGMAEVSIGTFADPFYVDPFDPVEWRDGRTYWTVRP